MATVFESAVAPVVLGSALAVCCVAAAQPTGNVTEPDPSPPESTPTEEIVVYGSIHDLRSAVWRAEESLFARFNEINSDDAFDVHCYRRPRRGSRITERVCLSNSWRAEEANIGAAVTGTLGGDRHGPPPGAYYAQQQYMQQRLTEEVRRLLVEDAELRQAALRLQEAQLAFSGRKEIAQGRSAARLVSPDEAGLPFDAQRLYEVRIGRGQWIHPLTESTFAIANVAGEISRLGVSCNRRRTWLEYQPDSEWNVPNGRSDCTLHVSARPGTTFQLYEFAVPFQD